MRHEVLRGRGRDGERNNQIAVVRAVSTLHDNGIAGLRQAQLEGLEFGNQIVVERQALCCSQRLIAEKDGEVFKKQMLADIHILALAPPFLAHHRLQREMGPFFIVQHIGNDLPEARCVNR